jgi:hypothetical protein
VANVAGDGRHAHSSSPCSRMMRAAQVAGEADSGETSGQDAGGRVGLGLAWRDAGPRLQDASSVWGYRILLNALWPRLRLQHSRAEPRASQRSSRARRPQQCMSTETPRASVETEGRSESGRPAGHEAGPRLDGAAADGGATAARARQQRCEAARAERCGTAIRVDPSRSSMRVHRRSESIVETSRWSIRVYRRSESIADPSRISVTQRCGARRA